MRGSKRFIFLTITIATVVFGIVYLKDFESRQKEIKAFFNNEEELAQIVHYFSEKTDFCSLPWPLSLIERTADGPAEFSPSKKFRLEEYKNDSKNGFAVYNTTNNKKVLVGLQDLSMIHTRWALDEKYLVYMTRVNHDDDFAVAQIYIANIESAKILHIAEAAKQNCEVDL